MSDLITLTGPGGFNEVVPGTGYWMPPNAPMVSNKGLWVSGAGSNLCFHSQTIATAGGALIGLWTVIQVIAGIPQVTGLAALAPDGTMSAALVSFDATNGAGQYSLLYQNLSIGAGDQTISFWARSVTGTGVLYFNNDDGNGAVGNPTACNLTTTWQRFSNTVVLPAGSRYIFIGPNGIAGSGQPTTQPALSVYLWGVQVEANPFASPYVATTGVAVPWAATAASVPCRLTDIKSYCVGWKGNLAKWTATAAMGNEFLFSTDAGANQIYCYNDTVGTLDIVVRNVAGYRRWYWFHGFADSTVHTITVLMNEPNISIYVDGVKVPAGLITFEDGGGGGWAAVPVTFAIGSYAGGSPISGYVQKFVQGRTYAEVAAELNRP